MKVYYHFKNKIQDENFFFKELVLKMKIKALSFLYFCSTLIFSCLVVDLKTASAQTGTCNYYTGKSINGQNISLDLCSISRTSQQTVNFIYYFDNERVQSQANCQSRTWATFPENALQRPQSGATRDMLQLICTAPSFNPGIAIGVVFDPPSNVRNSSTGIILCTIRELTAIQVSGGVVGDGWLRTSVCGSSGVIHQSQVRFNRGSNE